MLALFYPDIPVVTLKSPRPIKQLFLTPKNELPFFYLFCMDLLGKKGINAPWVRKVSQCV